MRPAASGRGRFAGRGRILLADERFLAACGAIGIENAADLGSGRFGAIVTQHRSSWVRRLCTDHGVAYIKSYCYYTYADRFRGIFRTTMWAPSRAAREAQALLWLKSHGFNAPNPLLVFECRSFCMLSLAVLVTSAGAGVRLDDHLSQVDDAGKHRTLAGLVQFVKSLHAAGFRDRNLDPRNILVAPAPGNGVGTFEGYSFTKIDSPRYRLVAPGTGTDALADADWTRLRKGLDQVDCPLPIGPLGG